MTALTTLLLRYVPLEANTDRDDKQHSAIVSTARHEYGAIE
jgi:hypothetical protein